MIVKDRCSYINRVLCLFQSYRVSRKLCLLWAYRVIIAIELYLKTLEVYIVIDFIFTRKNFTYFSRLYLLKLTVIFIMSLWSYIYYRIIFEDIRAYDLLECFL